MKLKALILIFAIIVLAAFAPNFTGFSSLSVTCVNCSTATPALYVNQASGTGGGVVADFRYNGTPSWQVITNSVTTQKANVAGSFILSQQSEIVTATFIITPTAPYIVLSSTGAYTSSTSLPIITTTATTGQLLIIRNGNAADALVIDGTGGTVECKANVTLGASDTLTLIYNGTVWNCVAGYDNS